MILMQGIIFNADALVALMKTRIFVENSTG